MTRRRLPRDHDLRGDPLALACIYALHTRGLFFTWLNFAFCDLTHILNRAGSVLSGDSRALIRARIFFHSRRDEEPILNRDTSTDIRIIIPARLTRGRINAGRDGVWPPLIRTERSATRGSCNLELGCTLASFFLRGQSGDVLSSDQRPAILWSRRFGTILVKRSNAGNILVRRSQKRRSSRLVRGVRRR